MGPPTKLADAIEFYSKKAEEAAGQWFMDDFSDLK